MDSGTRMPTWRERENNKRRERRRRAIAAKIYAGLRIHGNFKLPKHCDNNAVLKALCEEAGWTVEEDGTTYRKGCKPVDRLDAVGPSASPSPCSSYHPSPCASYNPSPTSSTLASPASSNLITTTQNTASGTEGNSLSPWLKSLSSASSSTSISSKLPNLPHIYIPGGSLSAPVTPPLSSPISQSPRIKTDWDNLTSQSSLACLKPISLPSSMPPSPGSQVTPDAVWFAGLSFPSGPTSPTYSLVSSNPLDFLKEASSSRMWTPGQSGTCSPVPPGGQNNGDVPTSDGGLDDFAFGSSSNGTLTAAGLVTPWEGERIHEECASDDLELTLGTAKAKSVY